MPQALRKLRPPVIIKKSIGQSLRRQALWLRLKYWGATEINLGPSVDILDGLSCPQRSEEYIYYILTKERQLARYSVGKYPISQSETGSRT
jgi:hypothetical protein